MIITEEMRAEDEKRWHARDVVTELGYCGKYMRDRKDMTNLDIRFYAYIMRKAHGMLKAQEPPKNASISSAIECLLHPQDADDSDMAKAIDIAVRAIMSLRDQKPRVLTYDELNRLHIDDVIWLEDIDKAEVIPAIVCGAPDYSSVLDAVELCAYYRNKYISAITKDYLKRWRCWTARPDEKVRAETPWQS